MKINYNTQKDDYIAFYVKDNNKTTQIKKVDFEILINNLFLLVNKYHDTDIESISTELEDFLIEADNIFNIKD